MTELEQLYARVYALEHALSDLLIACQNGTQDRQGRWYACPTESAMTRIIHRHLNILSGYQRLEHKREHLQYPVQDVFP